MKDGGRLCEKGKDGGHRTAGTWKSGGLVCGYQTDDVTAKDGGRHAHETLATGGQCVAGTWKSGGQSDVVTQKSGGHHVHETLACGGLKTARPASHVHGVMTSSGMLGCGGCQVHVANEDSVLDLWEPVLIALDS